MTIQVIALTIIIILIIILCTKDIWRDSVIRNNLRNQGVPVTGQIVKHRVEDSNRIYRCFLTFQYTFEGREYKNEQRVSGQGFNSVRDGEPIEILLMPQDPSISRLAQFDRFQVTYL